MTVSCPCVRRLVIRRYSLVALSLLVLLLSLDTFHSFHPPVETDTLRHLVILYTNDVHGHLEKTKGGGGAVGIMARWNREIGKDGDRFLILDGGDMWTGPVLSTYFQGESTIEVMNAMGYDAAAIGNHDFDFGLAALRQRAQHAHFPFLAANVRDKDGTLPDFLRPFIVVKVNQVSVGILGLTTGELLMDTNPVAVENLRLISYESALRDAAAQARAAGAELLILISHLCKSEAYHLASVAAEEGIAVLGGGHCHEVVNDVVDGVLLVQSGSFWDGYLRIDLYFDKTTEKVVDLRSVYVRNLPGRSDSRIEALLARWRAALPAELGEAIGYLRQPIGRESEAMAGLLAQAWMSAYPQAQIVLANPRYLAQPIPAGYLTPALWFDILPTNNTLLDVSLTGEQIVALLENHHPLYGGLVERNGQYVLANGASLEPDARYHVLLPQALYGHYDIRQFSPATVTDTGVDWRQAVIDWLVAHPTSPKQPLDEILP